MTIVNLDVSGFLDLVSLDTAYFQLQSEILYDLHQLDFLTLDGEALVLKITLHLIPGFNHLRLNGLNLLDSLDAY